MTLKSTIHVPLPSFRALSAILLTMDKIPQTRIIFAALFQLFLENEQDTPDIKTNKNKIIEISVSLIIQKYKFPIKSLDFSIIRPGFLFKGNVIKTLMNGIEVSFGGNIGTR